MTDRTITLAEDSLAWAKFLKFHELQQRLNVLSLEKDMTVEQSAEFTEVSEAQDRLEPRIVYQLWLELVASGQLRD